MIHSDWHIHTDASYDAKLPLNTLIKRAREQGLRGFGTTDHANFNDAKFMENIRRSAANYRAAAESVPEMILGVEFTPIASPEYDYIARTGTREGYVPVPQDTPYGIELALTLNEMRTLGIRYAVGAAHWRTDVADVKAVDNGVDAQIREWFRQQMALAADPRVTILGHPWSCNRSWYDDFSVIPRAMHDELGANLLEHGKYIECNVNMLISPSLSEFFRRQYAEFLRYMFEKGIPMTYGSDCHGRDSDTPDYPDHRTEAEKYLTAAGFREGDFSEISPDKWIS
ncbi:MAG: PHP domain-containing protein [Clostridiaceae bacterium]|nr:PHP domain-containing protein [Clostridiaceae bacterium]